MQSSNGMQTFASMVSWGYVGASGMTVFILFVFGGPMGLPFDPAHFLRLGPCSFVYWAFGFATELQTYMDLFTAGALLAFWIGLLAQLRMIEYVQTFTCLFGLCVVFLLEWLGAVWYLNVGWDSSVDVSDVARSAALGGIGLIWCVAYFCGRKTKRKTEAEGVITACQGQI